MNNHKLGSLACIFVALINSNRNDLVLTYFRKKYRRWWKLCLRISKIKSVSRTKRHSNNYFTVAVIEYVVGSLFFYRCSHVSFHRVIKETFADDLPWNVNTIQLFYHHITISMFGIIHSIILHSAEHSNFDLWIYIKTITRNIVCRTYSFVIQYTNEHCIIIQLQLELRKRRKFIGLSQYFIRQLKIKATCYIWFCLCINKKFIWMCECS